MNILVAGCSFSSNGTWPGILNEKLNNDNVINISFPGAGNKYISDMVISHNSLTDYDLTLVMWTGTTRKDEIVSINSNMLKTDYNFVKLHQTQLYVFSGGYEGSWRSNGMTKDLFGLYYKLVEEEQLVYATLIEILKTQGYLKSLGKPYYMMSYINYWNQLSDWRSRNLDTGINNYPSLAYLVDKIDFSKWIFINENKDGLFELASNNNMLQDDKFHPNEQANAMWTDIILDRLSKDNIK